MKRTLLMFVIVLGFGFAFITGFTAPARAMPFHAASGGYSAKVPWQRITLSATLKEYHNASLKWNAVKNAQGYELYRSTGKYGRYEEIADTKATSYTDESLVTGKTYYYKVRPYGTVNGASSTGSFSAVKAVSPKWPSISLKVSLSGFEAKLSFTKLAYAKGYSVERGTSKKGPYREVADVSIPSYTDKGLSADVTYYYRVRAYDIVGGQKLYGPYCSYKTIKAKWPVVTLTASASGYRGVQLNWNAIGGVGGYQVARSTSLNGTYTTLCEMADHSYTDNDLTANTTYYYKVRPYVEANGAKAFGKYSAVKSAKPSWPAMSLRAKQSDGQSLTLNWNSIGGVSGYEIERSSSVSGSYAKLGETADRSFTDRDVTAGSDYYYRVRAFVDEGGKRVYGPYCVAIYRRIYSDPQPLKGLVIGIDPGHQAKADYTQEPVSPGSKTKKAKVSSGTRGLVSKVYEYEIVLDVGLKLKPMLEDLGATVVMTRQTHNINISNSDRARLFNKNNTDYAIRLHCNGSTNKSVYGAYVLIPSSNPYLPDCKRAASLLTEAFSKRTGCKTYPYVQRSDQAGFNFCSRMIVNIEMGYLTNANEEQNLISATYQQRMVEGLTDGICAYFGVK